MRSCRAFRSLGPFIAILGSVISDTMKFAFLFFEFFIPYTVAFWILFGGNLHGQTMGEDSAENWEKFNDLTFSVWSVSNIFLPQKPKKFEPWIILSPSNNIHV